MTQRQLNFAVQITIDRIIFLRMAEDRGIEEYGRLQELLKGSGVYKRLQDLYIDADDRYNSGLFHFRKERDRPDPDILTQNLKIDDTTIKNIIRNLYYPDSPYEFSVFPVEVLGQVYEQFLGKVIKIAGRKITIEEKPEVKRAGGVYYTPSHVVDYIVGQTVGKLLQGKRPGPRGGASRIRILDPACGSGSFLIGAYQYLLDWHRDRYLEDGPEKHQRELYQGAGGQWLLTTQERKRILLNNIYGVDIDPQAVEVTKLSLLLKVLEGESSQSLVTQLRLFQERALPDLDNNIKCGNSLIGLDYYTSLQTSFLDTDEAFRINAFDWQSAFPDIMQAGGFDCVIGNPPYDVMEKERGASSWPHTALTDYVRVRPEYQAALGGKLNLFRFFIVRSLSLLREDGHFGMIVPLALLADISCANTRRHLFTKSSDLEADCFPQKDNPNRRIFKKAKLSTVVITNKKRSDSHSKDSSLNVRVYPWNSFDDAFRQSLIKFSETSLIDPKNNPIPLVDADNWKICLKIHSDKKVVRLGECLDFDVTRGEINQTIYRKFITDDPTMARLLKGVEVGPYVIRDKLSQGHREWFDEATFLRSNSVRPEVSQTRIATQRITGVDERLRVVATLVSPPTYFADSTNSITLRSSSPYRLEYLLGLLNSRLFQWRFKITSTNNNVGTNELDSMPFRTIDFSDHAERKLHDWVAELVERLLTLHQHLAEAQTSQERSILRHQIDVTVRQVDDLVYGLYGLDEQDIALVEGVASVTSPLPVDEAPLPAGMLTTLSNP